MSALSAWAGLRADVVLDEREAKHAERAQGGQHAEADPAVMGAVFTDELPDDVPVRLLVALFPYVLGLVGVLALPGAVRRLRHQLLGLELRQRPRAAPGSIFEPEDGLRGEAVGPRWSVQGLVDLRSPFGRGERHHRSASRDLCEHGDPLRRQPIDRNGCGSATTQHRRSLSACAR